MLQQNGKLIATDPPRAVLDLFYNYVHGRVNRRGFLCHCPGYVGVAAASTMLLCGRFWAQSCRYPSSTNACS